VKWKKISRSYPYLSSKRTKMENTKTKKGALIYLLMGIPGEK
jgi:hypothetical protein